MFGWLFGHTSDSEYDNGYNDASDFLAHVDHDLSDEECNAQWNAVERHHSQEYVQGYAGYVEETASTPWWKFW